MTVHELKCWPAFFDAVARGDKTFELRKNDRGFQTGDVLILRKFDPFACRYLDWNDLPTDEPERSAFVRVRVTYVLSGFGLGDGYVALGIKFDLDEGAQ